jgi:Mg2+/Co2+ transporter CorB
MTPRSQIEVVDIDALPEDLKRQISTSNHTRMPVYRGSLDNIIVVRNLGAQVNQAFYFIRELLKARPEFTPICTTR